MTKKPHEIRNKRINEDQTTENHKINKKCIYCESAGEIKIDNGMICLDCFADYCEICNQMKPFITVRKDTKNLEHKFIKQTCSDCYLNMSNDIVKLDASYGIESIDIKKVKRYE